MAGLLDISSYTIACIAAVALSSSPASFLSSTRPVHLALLTILCSIASLLFVAKYSRAKVVHAENRSHYADVLLHALQDDSRADFTKEKDRKRKNAASSAVWWGAILVAAIVLASRIELQRKLFLAAECATQGVEVWLPFLTAVYDALRSEKHRAIEQDYVDVAGDDLCSGVRHDRTRPRRSSSLASSWRHVPAAFLLSLGCHLVAGLWSSSETSRVCPLVSNDSILLPRLQWLALFLDIILFVSALELSEGGTLPSPPLLTVPISWIIVLALATSAWLAVAAILFKLQPENRDWLLLTAETDRLSLLFRMTWQALFLTAFCLSCLYSITSTGILHTSMALTAWLTTVCGTRFVWSVRKTYLPIASINLTWSFVIICLAWSMFSRTCRAGSSTKSEPSRLRRAFAFLLLGIPLYPGLTKSHTVHRHPIELLMYDAQIKHKEYLSHASRSTNLAEAVENYQNAYHDRPPPSFDMWYEFAKSRSVHVMDEYDQIYNDLLPFRAISPSDLRRQTWQMVSNPWNEIAGISIRGGKAEVQGDVVPTHRWMLEGVIRMIDNFSQHLPDMDLAFNLNDECRVAVPFENIRSLRDSVLDLKFRGTASFSDDRTTSWDDVSMAPFTDTVFEDWSFRNTYQEWTALTCSPQSPARKAAKSLFRSRLCLNCVADHSLGQFISNWSNAADPCHQPDLANLHGFYLSPAAFKPTHSLRPLFSQSKVPGFNDILYPSAWNYMDKVAYRPTNTSFDDRPAFPDPPYRKKHNTMYWRGATSEGVSTGVGSWRGMVRQRMVHMANNLTASQRDKVTILLPNKKRQDQYTYVTIAGTSLPQIDLRLDIRFVDRIVRCGGRDCEEQERELGLASPEDFQHHWQYKHLVDLDGAGFSGRFLPFLQSHSLPYKAALFREWYDSRLVPWLHFVPLDLRLHGLWSTLAYFAGVKGKDVDGTQWDWEGHEQEGELIAEAGREWGNKVLRKQDMEAYFFRLLLEWARLTDDRRDNLGFTLLKTTRNEQLAR